jgi:trigger factor
MTSNHSIEALQSQLKLRDPHGHGKAVTLTATDCDLSTVELELPERPTLDEAALETRLAERLRAIATRRERGRNEKVAEGDDVVLDVLGYAHGRLIPFSVRSNWTTEVAPDPALPGFFAALVGVRVGDSLMISITMPEDAPEALRNAEARFLVEVKQAFEVEPIEQSPATWPQRLGAPDLETALERLASEFEAETAEAAEAEILERLLDAVAERTEVEVPSEVIDREVELAWQRLERPHLVAHDFSRTELDEALEGWLADDDTRAQAERRLRVTAGLDAVVSQYGLAVDAGDRLELEATLADAASLPVASFSAAVAEVHDGPAQLDALALRLLAIDTLRREFFTAEASQ